MDRFAAMLVLLGFLASIVLTILALFAVAPVICTCVVSLLYSLYLFMAYEESGVHHAQEFENRFWTIFAVLLSTALFFAKDSPIAFGHEYPSLGFVGVLVSGYAMHLWDRYVHRIAISQNLSLLRRNYKGNSSLERLQDLGIPVEDQLEKINECLRDIDQLLIPSTINNLINQSFVFRKEREIISIFEECDARAMNYLISHVKLGLLFYKIKDHRNFAGQHRSQLIRLLAVDRLSILTVMSRVIVLHALQLLKLRANPRAEYWVRNIILNTNQDGLSELKTLTDAKGDYFCMTKLIYDDIRSETVRQDILSHIRKEAAVQQAHMQMRTKRAKKRQHLAWRKILSDVDDTLYCSGGSYPAGIDKRYAKKDVYPGVLAFYRELDLGTQGPEEWPENRVGNLVFLSARPHVYKDMSEKANFAKFEKLRVLGNDGRKGMHTVPSLLAGDLASGSHYIVTNDFEPLAQKKFDNFQRYVSIYPEYRHVFVCDNGQGDVRAGEMMHDNFPYEVDGMYVHIVQDVTRTFGYKPERWKQNEFTPCFFRTYPEAALHAATRKPPHIRITGLRRVCHDAAQDFLSIVSKSGPSFKFKAERRLELNQAIWRANIFLQAKGVEPVPLIEAERLWEEGQKVRTPYGIAKVRGFDPKYNLYKVELDWRPLNVQLAEYLADVRNEAILPRSNHAGDKADISLETVVEIEEIEEQGDNILGKQVLPSQDSESKIMSDEEVIEERKPPMSHRTPPTTRQIMPTGTKPPSIANVSDISVQSADSADDGSLQELESDACKGGKESPRTKPPVYAWISGHQISKFTPPILPKIDKTRGAIFTLWSPSGRSGSGLAAKKAPQFRKGDQCGTPYGPATVVEHRVENGIVVVEMIGWKARGYVKESDLKIISTGILGSLLRQLGGKEGTASATRKPVVEFPHAEGIKVLTPFGEGSIFRPLPLQDKIRPDQLTASHATTITGKESVGATLQPSIGISITSWTLADGSHPSLYCTVDAARKWKEMKEENKQQGILSAFGTLVSSSKTLLGPFLSAQQQQKQVEEDSVQKFFKQYYLDAAAVTTQFGDGVVLRFRPDDGFYEVSLIDWILTNGSRPVAYLRKDDIGYRIAKNCQEGYPVLTDLGLTGNLASVEPTTGVHIVTIPSAGMVCYLQPNSIVRPLKAAVGEDVLTAYGEGKLVRYRIDDDTYEIRLSSWGNNAILYAKAETFGRVSDGTQDVHGAFGLNWLLRFFFPPKETESVTHSRSRSNSMASVTGRSRSNSIASHSGINSVS